MDKSASSLSDLRAARNSERARLVVALQDALIELASLKSNLQSTKADIGGLRCVHGNIVKYVVHYCEYVQSAWY